MYFCRPKKYKKVAYEAASDSDLQGNQQETAEQDTNLEQQKRQERPQQQQHNNCLKKEKWKDTTA